MTDETKEVEALMGPYRGQRLTMPAAEAENAINDHWAIDPYAPRDDDNLRTGYGPDVGQAEGKQGEGGPGSTRENVEQQHTEGQPLTDEERTHALEAAKTWAQAQWDAAQGTGEPPPVLDNNLPPEGESEAQRQRREAEERRRREGQGGGGQQPPGQGGGQQMPENEQRRARQQREERERAEKQRAEQEQQNQRAMTPDPNQPGAPAGYRTRGR